MGRHGRAPRWGAPSWWVPRPMPLSLSTPCDGCTDVGANGAGRRRIGAQRRRAARTVRRRRTPPADVAKFRSRPAARAPIRQWPAIPPINHRSRLRGRALVRGDLDAQELAADEEVVAVAEL